MKQLGVSIYPEHSTLDRDKEYISLAHSYGFKRVFTSMLSTSGDQRAIIHKFTKTIQYASQLGMQVMIDVSPQVLSDMGVSYEDLSLFQQLGAYGIRLDLGYTGSEESLLTYNPYNLKIELNMSLGTKQINNILSYKPLMKNLLGSHNFYPHRYTGISYPHFVKASQSFKELGIRTAAFVNSPVATFGPWPVMEGLCTLEMHRELPIAIQVKHLFATGLIDDVIIANAYASEDEFTAISAVNPKLLTFNIELDQSVTALEREIVCDTLHVNRGDVSDYVIRSTQSRKKNQSATIKPTHARRIRRGDILIDNKRYGQYQGELQIALQEMDHGGKTNIVGRIVEEELFLLEYIQSWSKFRFCVLNYFS